ncbi:DUF5681 domain-containing protein [Phreatobacter sp.]|uniref:DUF5681 domain-containing protein n=1 Tax=Phreatobacter sp. TaxID=1966341 RepID=UPI003F702409
MSNDNDDGNGPKNYKVGKGKPPLHTRFQKGISGNKDGGRKRRLTLAELVRKVLYDRFCTITIDGEKKVVPLGEAILIRVASDAAAGKAPAASQIIHLLEKFGPASAAERIDSLSRHDEEVLAGLAARQNLPLTACREHRIVVGANGVVEEASEGIDETDLAHLEHLIEEARTGDGCLDEVLKALEALACIDTPAPEPNSGAATFTETVTAILYKGDGAIEFRKL